MATQIQKHITPSSLRELWKLNIIMVLFSFISASLLLLLIKEAFPVIWVLAFKTTTHVLITSSLLVIILKYTARKFYRNNRKFKFWRYSLSHISGIIVYLTLWPIFANLANIPIDLESYRTLIGFVSVAIILTSIIIFLHNYTIQRQHKIQTELKVSQLQMRTAEAENLLLKQQIQPHFLFNALNTLDALYINDLERGTAYLIKLADFLRATVSQHHRVAATLEQELTICRNYMGMQEIRFGEALKWDVITNDLSVIGMFLPSFSLQPLLENAIKHNMFDKEQPLRIVIEQQGAYVTVRNPISAIKSGEPSIKSGLANLAERYKLWSGNELLVTNDGYTFSVSLKMMMDENNNN